MLTEPERAAPFTDQKRRQIIFKMTGSRTGRSGCGVRFQVVSGAGRTASFGELADCVDDPAPHGGAVVVLLGEKLIGVRGAFLERFLAVALSIRLAARQISISGI